MQRLSSILALGALLVFILATGALAGPVVNSQQTDPSAMEKYWTPERMRAAKPMPMPQRQQGPGDVGQNGPDRNIRMKSERGPSGSTPPYCPDCKGKQPQALNVPDEGDFNLDASCPASNYYTFADTYNTEYPERVMGKIFFTAWGDDMVCSGTLVGARVVLTASHCVCDQYGFYDNVIFVPGYQNGWEPYGRGSKKRVWAYQNYATHWNDDVAMIILWEDLGSYLGWAGMTWNEDDNYWTQFGYPSNWPYDGQILYVNQSYLGNLPSGGELDGTLQVGSGFTPGASGGGWMIYYDGWPYANGVNSYYLIDCPNTFGSPYFASQFTAILDAVNQDLAMGY